MSSPVCSHYDIHQGVCEVTVSCSHQCSQRLRHWLKQQVPQHWPSLVQNHGQEPELLLCVAGVGVEQRLLRELWDWSENSRIILAGFYRRLWWTRVCGPVPCPGALYGMDTVRACGRHWLEEEQDVGEQVVCSWGNKETGVCLEVK